MCNILDRYDEQNILDNLQNEELDLDSEELSDANDVVILTEEKINENYMLIKLINLHLIYIG